MLKKGAMFGLDARIALAIFGALSVISGAALYSAIQQSQATAKLVEMQEVAKAVEQYILDTGVEVWLSDASIGARIGDLVKNPGVDGWNGPYVPYEWVVDDTLKVNDSYTAYLRVVSNNDWAHPSDNGTVNYCANNSGDPCYLWVMFKQDVDISTSLASAIDEEVDGEVDFRKGNFRKTTTEMYLKIMPTIKKY
jgi:type II secretory pathway pseudopilin PulG